MDNLPYGAGPIPPEQLPEFECFHEIASVFPSMSGAELEALADDIDKHGQLQPVAKHQGRIVDGRARWRACLMRNIAPWCQDLALDSDLVAHVVSANGLRLHMTEIQRGMAASRIAKLGRGRPIDDAEIVGEPTIKAQRFTQEEAGQLLNVSRDTVNKCRRIVEHGGERLTALAVAGNVSVEAGYRLAKEPREVQDDVIGALPAESLSVKNIELYIREDKAVEKIYPKWETILRLFDKEMTFFFQERGKRMEMLQKNREGIDAETRDRVGEAMQFYGRQLVQVGDVMRAGLPTHYYEAKAAIADNWDVAVFDALQSREQWLNEAVDRLRPYYRARGLIIPERIRVSVGFTSKGMNSKRIGETWSSDVSHDGTTEIFLRPDLWEASAVMATLSHELIHAAAPGTNDHGAEFKKHMEVLGMIGRATQAKPGPKFQEELNELVSGLGPFPHAKLDFQRVRAREALERNRRNNLRLLRPAVKG